jgi:hypothetical protein
VLSYWKGEIPATFCSNVVQKVVQVNQINTSFGMKPSLLRNQLTFSVVSDEEYFLSLCRSEQTIRVDIQMEQEETG